MGHASQKLIVSSIGEGDGLSTGVTGYTEGEMGFPGDDRTLCRASVRVTKGGDTGSLGGKGFECVARDDVWSEPGSGCRGEGELEVGDLTLIGKGVGNP